MLIKISNSIAALILLLMVSPRQAHSCETNPEDTREISFIPGIGDRVLNMEEKTKKSGLINTAEDDSGFLGAYEMVKFLTTEVNPDEARKIIPAKYKDQFKFLNERAEKLYLDFSSVLEYPGRKEILESIRHLIYIGSGLTSVTQEEIAEGWQSFLKALDDSSNGVTVRYKKPGADAFGESESIKLKKYYDVVRTRVCQVKTNLNISQRFGADQGTKKPYKKSAQ